MELSILTITVFFLVLTVLSLTSGVLTIGKKEQQDLSRRAYGQRIDKVINELKILSGGESLNIELPDDALIANYEKDIGFTFPEDYKKALKEVSNVFYGTVELLSVTRDRNYYGELAQALHDAKEQGVPEGWLPICEDNGSYYCLVPDGQVRYWTTDSYSDEKWPNLASWIKQVWIEGN